MDTSTTPHTQVTTQRGRIISYQTNGQGSVSVAGAMLAFDATKHWRSDSAPVPNATVDVARDTQGAITGMTLVPAQQVAQEEAARAAGVAKEKGRAIWSQARTVLGDKVLGCMALLVAGAFFFNLVSVRSYASISRTYWELLALTPESLNNLAGAAGGFSMAQFFFLLALVACTATMFTSHPKAALGKCAPLLFMLLHGAGLYMKVKSLVADASAGALSFGGAQAADMAARMVREMMAQVWQGVSFGLGLYVVLLAAMALACFGLLEYRARARG